MGAQASMSATLAAATSMAAANSMAAAGLTAGLNSGLNSGMYALPPLNVNGQPPLTLSSMLEPIDAASTPNFGKLEGDVGFGNNNGVDGNGLGSLASMNSVSSLVTSNSNELTPVNLGLTGNPQTVNLTDLNA